MRVAAVLLCCCVAGVGVVVCATTPSTNLTTTPGIPYALTLPKHKQHTFLFAPDDTPSSVFVRVSPCTGCLRWASWREDGGMSSMVEDYVDHGWRGFCADTAHSPPPPPPPSILVTTRSFSHSPAGSTFWCEVEASDVDAVLEVVMDVVDPLVPVNHGHIFVMNATDTSVRVWWSLTFTHSLYHRVLVGLERDVNTSGDLLSACGLQKLVDRHVMQCVKEWNLTDVSTLRKQGELVEGLPPHQRSVIVVEMKRDAIEVAYDPLIVQPRGDMFHTGDEAEWETFSSKGRVLWVYWVLWILGGVWILMMALLGARRLVIWRRRIGASEWWNEPGHHRLADDEHATDNHLVHVETPHAEETEGDLMVFPVDPTP